MKNVLCEKKKIKLWNKWHFVENKTEIMQCVLQMPQISLNFEECFYMYSHIQMQVI